MTLYDPLFILLVLSLLRTEYSNTGLFLLLSEKFFKFMTLPPNSLVSSHGSSWNLHLPSFPSLRRVSSLQVRLRKSLTH